MILNEDTRQQLLSKSKRSVKGNLRFKRRLKSRFSHAVREYNQINMNDLFKIGVFTVNVPIIGETNNYLVTIRFDGFLDILHQELKRNNNQLDSKVITRTLIRCFNQEDTYIYCTCLHPDTKVKLLDGSIPTVAEMKERFDSGEKLYVYSADENGDFKPGEVEKVWITETTTKFVKIVLDNDKEILTTPDHLYMLRNGEYCQALDLTVGQSLMPMYFSNSNGYETVKFNTEVRGFHTVYKLVADYFYHDLIEKTLNIADTQNMMPKGVAVHHKDFNKSNNNPDNLLIMTARDHWDYHANTVGFKRLWQDEEWRNKAIKRASEHIKKLNANPTEALKKARVECGKKNSLILNSKENIEKYHKMRSDFAKNVWPTLVDRKKIIENLLQSIKNGCLNTEKFHAARIREGKRLFSNPENLKKMLYGRPKWVFQLLINNNLELTEENYNKYKRKTDPYIKTLFKDIDEAIAYYKLNHKVKSIEFIELENTPVYDIKVKDFHNFCVEAGVILHNCPDSWYRYSYQLTKNNISSGPPQNIPAPITNPNDTLGSGCKHTLLVLNNNSWLLKCAAVIYNYINYMKEHRQKLYADIIYPAIYEIDYTGDVLTTLFDDEEVEDSEIIDKSNINARNKSLFKRGNTQGIRFASNEEESEQTLLDID